MRSKGMGLVTLLVVASVVVGQEEKKRFQFGGPGGGPGGFQMMGGGSGLLMTLLDENVQKSLKVTEDEKGILQLLREESREADQKSREAMRDASREERQKMMNERRKEVEKQLTEVLGTQRVARLKQIQLQIGGIAMAVNNPEVAEKLKIDDAFREQVREIQFGDRDTIRDKMDELRDNPEAMQKFFAERQKTIETKIMALLSDNQKAAWKELIGDPIDFQPQPFRFGMGRGGPGGEGKRGEGKGRGRRDRDKDKDKDKDKGF